MISCDRSADARRKEKTQGGEKWSMRSYAIDDNDGSDAWDEGSGSRRSKGSLAKV